MKPGASNGSTNKSPLLAKGDIKKDLTYFGSWLILINAMLGASVVALPYVVKISGGVIQYLLLLSCAVVGNVVTITVYVQLADETDSRFVFELCEKVVKSNTLANVYIVAFIFKAYTILLVSITFFADQFEIFLELIIGASDYDENAKFYRFLSIVACVIFSIPFVIPKKINMLQIPGILTCISSCSIVFVTLFIYTEHRLDQKESNGLPTNDTNLWDFLGAVPILVLGLGAHEMSIICYDSVGETRQLRQWYKVIMGLYSFAFLAFTLVGVLGYLAFGDEVKDDFLLNCDPGSVVACIARVAMMISVLTSFVERIYMCRYYCDNVYRKLKNLDFEEGERTWTVRRHVQTVIIMICVLVPASFIHGFRDVGNFAGILSCFMSFGLPGICLFAKFKQSRGKNISTKSSYEHLDNTSDCPKPETDSGKGMVNLFLGLAILSVFMFVLICGIVSAVYIIIIE